MWTGPPALAIPERPPQCQRGLRGGAHPVSGRQIDRLRVLFGLQRCPRLQLGLLQVRLRIGSDRARV
jgi:hypothetical protein